MVLVETQEFSRRISRDLDDDQYHDLQTALCKYPEAGDVIPGSGGFRKIRWHVAGRGKRGGLRVIYFREMSEERIYLLDVYAKNEKANLARGQLKVLRRLVEGDGNG